VEADILASASASPGSVFNIGGGSRITVNELIEELAKTIGKPAKVTFTEQQIGDVADTLADITKADSLLGWKPGVSIREGARKYVQWYLGDINNGKDERI
jgi:UDP-glucose 4-epimerase